jgi:UDP:flavonoid glycosyltransferase YjiC (YdhE family)
MASLLILTVDGSGNVPPALAIGAELVRRGHTVRVLGHARQAADVAAHGLDFVPYRHAFPWSGQQTRSSVRAALDFVRLVGDPGGGIDAREALRARPTDAVLVDAMIPGALRAALQSGVPTAALMHTFAEFFLARPMEAAGRFRGFSPRAQWAAARTLVVTDRALDPARDDPRAATYAWTGVAERPPKALAEPVSMAQGAQRPLVLVSLSSVHIPAQQGMMQRILDGLARLPVTVVATTGPTIDPSTLRVPDGATIHRHVPHHDVMPAASLVVGHGGHSTTVRALMHGLPLLILPADPRIDQGMVGRAVARAGAGLCLPRSSSPDAIREAAARILTTEGFAREAAVAGARIREANGVGSAADAIESLARTTPRGSSAS